MNEFVWSLNKYFLDPEGNEINVLQRTLPDIEGAKRKDFLPFFSEISLFQLSTFSEHKVEKVIGRLLGMKADQIGLWVSVRSVNSIETTWQISAPHKPTMTIWRINDVLDTLQVNVRGKCKELYMQTGGTRLFELLEHRPDRDDQYPAIKEAERIFLRNVISRIE
jgi:hypothetical protein